MIFSNINMATISVVPVFGHLLTDAPIITYTRQQNKNKAIDMFLLSKLPQSAAWVMLGPGGMIPNMVLVAVGDSALFTGTALELITLMITERNYTKKIKKHYTVLLVCCIAVFIGAIVYGFPENTRTTFASSVIAPLVIFPVYKLLTDQKASTLQKVIAVLCSLTIPFLIFRVIAALATDLDINLASTSIFNTWLFSLLYVVMLTGGTGFILLDEEKQDLGLLKAASFDGLTNVLNRRTFTSCSKELISLCLRRQERISFLLIDIDDFKKIDGKYGHFVGNVILQDFADTLKKQLRDYGLFDGYSGEEFAILLPGADEKTVQETVGRLRPTIGNSSVGAGPSIKCTTGVSFFSILSGEETDINMPYKPCGQTPYLVKSQGKSCYRSTTEIWYKIA